MNVGRTTKQGFRLKSPDERQMTRLGPVRGRD